MTNIYVDESHDADPATWFSIGKYPECRCGFAPRDNIALIEHWREAGFMIVENKGQLVKLLIKQDGE